MYIYGGILVRTQYTHYDHDHLPRTLTNIRKRNVHGTRKRRNDKEVGGLVLGVTAGNGKG